MSLIPFRPGPSVPEQPIRALRYFDRHNLARGVTVAVLATSGLLFGVGTAAADTRGHTDAAVKVDESARAQQIADTGAANAAANDIEQSVAVIDRTTGALVADHNGDTVYNTESILKLFTAAYYLLQDGGTDPEFRDQLRTMVSQSDNDIQTELWNYDIIPTIAERYGLTDTDNGPYASAQSWGSDQTTANDQARFLYAMSVDQAVGPILMSWMAATTPIAADGFDQSFGLAALTGFHGSKQGWSDPDWSPANLHSVGWTGRYFVAILQTSPSASYATMRATSTTTARSMAAAADVLDGQAVELMTHPKFGRVIRMAFSASGTEPSVQIGWIAAAGSSVDDW